MDQNGVIVLCYAWGSTMDHKDVIVLCNARAITMDRNGVIVHVINGVLPWTTMML